ncbi:MAG: methyltransferase [Candidatus Kapaibacterium sp.]|nr:MAG: methyltransferase [Candidatus Kapabacteria bacterium]
MRVIAGRWGGRILPARVPPGTRPTQDAVREAMFNMIAHRMELAGAVVLDLFAGTGSLGIEALSRGASHCTFVERSGRACTAIEDNCHALSIEREQYRILREDAIGFVEQCTEAFDLVVADPPYAARESVANLCQVIERSACLHAGTLVVIEHAAALTPVTGTRLVVVAHRKWGQTAWTLFAQQ